MCDRWWYWWTTTTRVLRTVSVSDILHLSCSWKNIFEITLDKHNVIAHKRNLKENGDSEPLKYHQLAVVLDTKKDCRDSERERRQTEMVTVAPAWQLMSSQFNHRMGSRGSWKFICISLNAERLFDAGSQNWIGWRKGWGCGEEANRGARY